MKKPKELQSQFVTWMGDRLMLENEWQHRDWVWFSNLLHGEQEAVGLCARYGPVCLGTTVAVVG